VLIVEGLILLFLLLSDVLAARLRRRRSAERPGAGAAGAAGSKLPADAARTVSAGSAGATGAAGGTAAPVTAGGHP
jgi:hypothetical protein